MDWYQNLYIGETIKQKRDFIIQKIEKKKRVSELQLIILPTGDQNQLEVISCEQLYRYQRAGKQIRILGLASGKKEAYDLICMMAEEVYQAVGSAEMRQYYSDRFL